MSKGSERTSGTLSLRGQGYIALLGAALTLVILLFVLWQACAIYEDNLILNKQVEVNAQLSSNGNSLENRINNILSHLDGLDAFAKANPTKTALDTHFESFAFGLYAGSSSLRSIEIYTNFSETYVYPLEDNELVAERTLEDLINDERPIVRADLLNAIQTREPVITGPYEMQRGGLGMAARQPVYINDSLWGVVSMVIDVPPLLSSSGLTTADETIHMALRYDSGQILFGSEETFQMEPLVYYVILPEGSWELAAVPTGGWDESVADTLLVFQKGGIIIVILLTLIVYLLLSYSVSLKMEVKTRTASLKESESRYRQLFDNNSDSLFLFDENGKILDANKVAEDLYGYDRNQFLNMKVRDLSPINLRDEISPLKEITDTGAQFQWTHLRRNGAEFPVHINASPIELDNKKYILASVRDITESKEVEKALTESERRYRLLTDTARDFIIVHDLQGKLLYANKIAVEFSGYSEKELLSLNVTHFVSPAEQAKMYERRDHRVENNGETYLYETVFVDKDGNEIPVEVSSVPMQGENLKPSILIVARDITERKMTQSALIKSEEMFATVFNTVPDSIMLTSFDGRIININQSFLKNKGYRMDEVLGISLCDLTIWSDPDICKQYIHQLTFHGVVRNFETDIYTKYGEKHSVIISGDIITTDSEKYILTVFRNVTELKDAEKKLRKSESLLNDVSRIAKIGGWSIDVQTGEGEWTPEVARIHDVDWDLHPNVQLGLDFYTHESRPVIEQAVKDAIENGTSYNLELEIISAKGVRKWIRTSGRPMTVDGKVVRLVGSFQDVTEIKNVELELHETDRLLNDVGRIAKIGGWEFDALTGEGTWTPEVARIYGLDPDDCTNRNYGESFFVAESKERIDAAINNCIETAVPFDVELELISADGVNKWVRSIGNPVVKDGRVVKLMGSFQDITERKLAADMLQESELRVRKKLNAILEPEGDLGELELADIVDIKALQELMDEFYQLTKMGGMAILDLKGNVLVDIGWQDICTKFHRVHPQTCKHCIESDLELTRGVELGTYKFYKCKNHMWDMVTPIMLGGVHIGNLFVGQFFLDDEEIPYDTFRLQAEKYGFDEKQYLEALEKVPRWNRESVDSLMTYYSLLTDLISTLSYSNVKLARTLNERDELLASLHESESRFRATFEQAAVGVILSSLDGGFIQMNQRFCDISGYSCEELIKMNFADFTSPEDIEKETLLVEELVSGKRRNYSIEKRFICKGGRMLWVNVTVALVKSSDGEPLYFIGMVEDIDSRKLAEAEIELKSNALENSLNGFNIISSDGTFVYANKAYIRMWGYDTLNDVLESSPSSYFKYPEIAVDIFNKLRENGECTFEFTALRKDGSTFEALMYSQLFKDTDDNEIYMGTSIDITDRKEAEAEILQYTERLNMLHAIDKGIISSTSSEDIINSVLKNLRELISCPIVRLRAMDYERNDTVVLAIDSEYDSELKVGTHEYIMPSPTLDKLKSGSSVIVPDLYSYDSYNHELIAKFRNEDVRSVLIAPLIIEGELMGVLNLSSFEVDFFTEEHRAIVEEVATQLSIAIHHSRLNDQIRQHADELEQRVAERTEQLEDANKELEAFTYSVSHDLRAPLRAIDGFSRIITEDYEPIMDDEGKRLLNVIRDNTQKMDKLITDLLALSRVGRNEMSCVLINMDAMVRSVFNDLIPDENKNRTVLNVSDLPESYVDPALIKQLWVNLLSNAIKYSSTRDKGVVEVGAYIKDGTNVYYVKDNGVGFNPKYSHKLFGIFQRLHSEKEFPGTGVGLAIVQRIARRHGGDVWAESELDNGATFYFSLPIKQGDDMCGE